MLLCNLFPSDGPMTHSKELNMVSHGTSLLKLVYKKTPDCILRSSKKRPRWQGTCFSQELGQRCGNSHAREPARRPTPRRDWRWPQPGSIPWSQPVRDPWVRGTQQAVPGFLTQKWWANQCWLSITNTPLDIPIISWISCTMFLKSLSPHVTCLQGDNTLN